MKIECTVEEWKELIKEAPVIDTTSTKYFIGNKEFPMSEEGHD